MNPEYDENDPMRNVNPKADHAVHPLSADLAELGEPELCTGCGQMHPKLVALSLDTIVEQLSKPEVDKELKEAGIITIGEDENGDEGWGLTEKGVRVVLTMVRFIGSIAVQLADDDDRDDVVHETTNSFIWLLRTMNRMGSGQELIAAAAMEAHNRAKSPMVVGEWKEGL